MEDLEKLEVKNWEETAKDRRNGRDLADTATSLQPVCEYFINKLHPLHLHFTLLTIHIYYPKNF